MATPKKTSVKKPATKKPAAKKPAAAVKKPIKRAAAVSKTTKKTAPKRRAFAISLVPDNQPFFTFRLTTQSIYWLIFSLAILGLGLWVLNLNLQILKLYDQIDRDNAAASITTPAVRKH